MKLNFFEGYNMYVWVVVFGLDQRWITAAGIVFSSSYLSLQNHIFYIAVVQGAAAYSLARIEFHLFLRYFFFFCLNFKTCKSHHCYIYKLGFLFLLVIFLGKLIRGKLGSELSGKYNELKTWKNVNVNILQTD